MFLRRHARTLPSVIAEGTTLTFRAAISSNTNRIVRGWDTIQIIDIPLNSSMFLYKQIGYLHQCSSTSTVQALYLSYYMYYSTFPVVVLVDAHMVLAPRHEPLCACHGSSNFMHTRDKLPLFMVNLVELYTYMYMSSSPVWYEKTSETIFTQLLLMILPT